MYQRKQLEILEKRIFERKNLIQVITGPRQVGKTTLANQLTKKVNIPFHFVSADAVPSSNSFWISQQWEISRAKFKNSGSKIFLFIIDEVQKINNWSEYIKKEWDKDRRQNINLRVILLGSSTLLVNKGLSESLMGRFEIIQLPHWSLSEMHDAFGFTPEQYVYFGAYPGAEHLISDETRWKDYIRNSIIEPTISKDILQLTNIQKPALLKNLFELGCAFSGEILSYTKILGQLTDAGNTTTLAQYQKLLDEVWLLSGLQKFSGSKIKSKSSPPKWIVYNTSLSSVYDELSFESVKNNLVRWGRKVEQAIGAYLINSARVNNFNVFYWREVNDEIDFLIQKNKTIIPIEVKLGKAKSHKGLINFSEKFSTKKSLLISDDGLKWQEFLKMDIVDLF
ncbi:MAG: ATPase AAA [Ignavibacterium sp.]|uniref:ATP-binding protein n=1 Tax=Ignavibacterium sp. TaxID=2651167 RepID=UPI0021DE043B|nr:AAA family ATPase [Ignavibacterium sp.]BDQ03060.1 MAG: ATPase AAA [Ignavibacterium sp.]GIV46129.1 MAG: ATPase AAA [Ignavibacterium sp.]